MEQPRRLKQNGTATQPLNQYLTQSHQYLIQSHQYLTQPHLYLSNKCPYLILYPPLSIVTNTVV